MLQNIIIVILMALLVAALTVIVLGIKAMKKLHAEADKLKTSIDVRSLSENVKKDVMKHVLLLEGLGKVMFLKK